MELHFYKYQGTGNDFILIDNRDTFFKKDAKVIRQLCDRKFGIGADGLILLENATNADFKMVYFNSDGKQSTMCGNGGRCIVSFAKQLNLISNSCIFMAVDGLHEAEIEKGNNVRLKMQNTALPQATKEGWFVDTGSPHFVLNTQDVSVVDVFNQGKRLRNEYFGEAGANINCVEVVNNRTIKLRTYERGVEDETLSCGTGVVASVLSMHHHQSLKESPVKVIAEGGELWVNFEKQSNGYQQIWLVGPAKFVFEGKINS